MSDDPMTCSGCGGALDDPPPRCPRCQPDAARSSVEYYVQRLAQVRAALDEQHARARAAEDAAARLEMVKRWIDFSAGLGVYVRGILPERMRELTAIVDGTTPIPAGLRALAAAPAPQHPGPAAYAAHLRATYPRPAPVVGRPGDIFPEPAPAEREKWRRYDAAKAAAEALDALAKVAATPVPQQMTGDPAP